MYVRQATWLPEGPTNFGGGLGTVLTLPNTAAQIPLTATNPSWQGSTSPDSLDGSGVNIDAFGYVTNSGGGCVAGADPSNPFCLSAAGQAAAAASPASGAPLAGLGIPSGMQSLAWLAVVAAGLLLFVKAGK